jgi:predicted RNase H-like HicB family nuclease
MYKAFVAASFTVILSPEQGYGYSVHCPAMPGAVSQGENREDALRNIAEAMEGWLDVATERGFGPLIETPELVAEGIARILGFRAEEGWPLTIETTVVQLPVAIAA